MTRKENLLIEAIAIENEIATLLGKAPFTFISDEQRRNIADKTTLYDLERRVKSAELALKSAKHQAKIDAYYATDEGKAFQTSCETRKKELKEIRLKALANTGSHCEKLIEEYLGSAWGLNLSEYKIEVGLLSEDEGAREFIFGHSFELRYEYEYDEDSTYEREFKLRLNYGCMGEFDPLTDKSRADFIIGLGKFVEPDFLSKLKSILQDLADQLSNMIAEYREVNNKLNDPFLPF